MKEWKEWGEGIHIASQGLFSRNEELLLQIKMGKDPDNLVKNKNIDTLDENRWTLKSPPIPKTAELC